MFTYTETYPDVGPQMSLTKYDNLDDGQVSQLQQLMTEQVCKLKAPSTQLPIHTLFQCTDIVKQSSNYKLKTGQEIIILVLEKCQNKR